ncbi:hypothetical protein WJX74_003948 [Apatococcus lobatus]|uniref:Uncharacterized protein n=1 Tax=Apatococcus lobatus TaxID=904363 RepID=A0AAW1RQ48_9CHLO
MSATTLGQTSFAGAALAPATSCRKAPRVQLCCRAQADKRQLLGLGALAGALVLSSGAALPARADLVGDLLEKSQANKALHDKQRKATSYANFETSRTVADGTCTFPNNLFGCGNASVAGKVKYIAEDRDLECQGQDPAHCASRMSANSIPKAFNKYLNK